MSIVSGLILAFFDANIVTYVHTHNTLTCFFTNWGSSSQSKKVRVTKDPLQSMQSRSAATWLCVAEINLTLNDERARTDHPCLRSLL